MGLVLKFLESPVLFAACIAVIFLTSIANLLVFTPQSSWTFDGLWANRGNVLQTIEAIYLLAAPRYVLSITPGLVERLRGVVAAPDAAFNDLKRKISGKFPIYVISLLTLFIAAQGLVTFISILSNAASNGMSSLGFSTFWMFLPTEIIVLVIATWRMFWLSRMAVQPLNINLLNPRPTFPFGILSFAYASLLSVRMLVRFVLFGSASGMMANAFMVFGVMSLLMLIVPILGAHNQMEKEKDRALAEIDNELMEVTKPILAPGIESRTELSKIAAPMESLISLRKRIASLWTWPVSSSLSAIRAILLSSLPVWLPFIKNYIWPILQALMSG
ncbi:MAG TPA: hypothetical protein PLW39_06045 [Thermoflexales bacterium]|nr:hypothetical protein [Thermoflexales bacterium]HQZ21815.1 hypothetical protein [Thermoflexales bacterium]